MPPPPSSMLQVGLDVLRTVRDDTTKAILAYLGDVVGATGDEATPGASDGERAAWWQHVGLVSRPSKPERGKAACQVVAYRQTDHDVVIASRDLRGLELAGKLEDGETCLYAGGTDGTGQARVILKADGAAMLYTKAGNVDGGGGMTVHLDAQTDTIRIVNSKGYGLVIDEDGVKLVTGSASLEMGADGVTLVATSGKAQIDGPSIIIGSAAVPVANAALKGPTGVAGSASLKTLIE